MTTKDDTFGLELYETLNAQSPGPDKLLFKGGRQPASAPTSEISFGPFRLLPAQFLLLKGDKAVSLGSRALEILIALLERPGELVTKQELMARVWPNIFVEPANLTVHISALRRALRDGHDGKLVHYQYPRTRLQVRRPSRIPRNRRLD